MRKFNKIEKGIIKSAYTTSDRYDPDTLEIIVEFGKPHLKTQRNSISFPKYEQRNAVANELCKVFGVPTLEKLKNEPCIIYWHLDGPDSVFDALESVTTNLTFNVHKELKRLCVYNPTHPFANFLSQVIGKRNAIKREISKLEENLKELDNEEETLKSFMAEE